MKYRLFLLTLFLAALSACRSLHVADFHSPLALPAKLPKLELMVHERSFLAAFDEQLSREWMVSPGPYGPEPWYAYETTDQALDDVFQLLGNELADNVNTASGSSYGNARFKLLYYHRSNPGWGWLIPSIATAWTANLFGMPYSNLRSELELQLEITDADRKVLGHYSARGSGKAMIALYHGYPQSQAIRKANLLALKDAMVKIKQNLAADASHLSEALFAGGALKPLNK